MTTPTVNLEPLRNRRILVTGASGFIGAQLCLRLHQLGARVIATSRNEQREPHPLVPQPIAWRTVALEDPRQTRALLKNTVPELIFHASGLAHGRQELEHVTDTLNANLLATVNLCTACAEQGRPKVILFGSMEETDRHDPLASPANPYAASKDACDIYARLFNHLYQLPIVNIRLFMTYGPHQYHQRKLIPYTILSLAAGRTPNLGTGTRKADWIFVDDVIEGLLRCALIENKVAQRVDLGTGRLYSVRSVVEAIARLMDSNATLNFGDAVDRHGQEREPVADIANTREHLGGWAPTTDLETGLQRTINWYLKRQRLFPGEWP